MGKMGETRLQELNDLPLASALPPSGAVSGFVFAVGQVLSHRELVGLLVARELKSRYKDSALGFIWSLIKPLMQLLIYYVAIGKFLGAERGIPLFAIFIFAGLTVWGLFSEVVSSTTSSIIWNSGLVKKVALPREIFAVSVVGSAGFNFLIQLSILLLATIALGTFPLSPSLILVPLATGVTVVLALAVGLALSALNVYFRDIQHLVEVLLMVLFWLSPVVYSYTFVHATLGGSWLEKLYLANPMTLVVLAFQKALWTPGADSLWPSYLSIRLCIWGAVGLLLLWASQRVFAKLQGNFAQEL